MNTAIVAAGLGLLAIAGFVSFWLDRKSGKRVNMWVPGDWTEGGMLYPPDDSEHRTVCCGGTKCSGITKDDTCSWCYCGGWNGDQRSTPGQPEESAPTTESGPQAPEDR